MTTIPIPAEIEQLPYDVRVQMLHELDARNEQLETTKRDDNLHSARSSLIGFTLHTFPGYVVDPWHQVLASTLDHVVAGKIKRLMIFAPPQHGKTQLTAIQLVSYWIGRRPNSSVIVTSYGADLAYDSSRAARQIVEGYQFGQLFPTVHTRRDSRAVDLWTLEGHQAKVRAGGVGGGIAGHGAHLGIIDDPHKNIQEAKSPVMQKHAYGWYTGVFRPRIRAGGAIVLMMTRWDQADLAGRILSAHDPGDDEPWYILRFPAIAETQEERKKSNEKLGLPFEDHDPAGRQPGEPLSPGRGYTLTEYAQLERDVGPTIWGSQYQQRPTPETGTQFDRVWFTPIEAAPPCLVYCRYWDKADTATYEPGAKDASFSVGLLMGLDESGKWYILDVVRGQWEAHTRETIILQTAKLDDHLYGDQLVDGHNPLIIRHEQEPGSGGKTSARATNALLSAYNVQKDIVSGKGPKSIRLIPFRAQALAHNVYMVIGAWNLTYLSELEQYPFGLTDQIDTSSGAFDAILAEIERRDKEDEKQKPFAGARPKVKSIDEL